MKRLIKLLGAMGLAVGLLSTSGLAAEKTPAGSFLRYRARSVNELVSQVKSDSVSRKRLAMHFRLAEKAMIDRVGGLKLVSLKSARRVTMWYVSSKGQIVSKSKLLPKGTMVFADETGKPTLAWSCGNPFTQGLTTKRPVKVAVAAPPAALPAPPEETVLSSPPVVLQPPVETAILPVTAPLIPDSAAGPILDVLAVPPVPAPPTPVTTGFSVDGLAAAGLLGFGFTEGGDTPVPEPTALAAMGAALAGFGGLALRLRRKS